MYHNRPHVEDIRAMKKRGEKISMLFVTTPEEAAAASAAGIHMLSIEGKVFDAEMRDSADFVLPHPRAADRLFVLAPAAQVAAEAVWPGIGRTIRELRDELVSDERVERIEAHAAL